MDFFFIKDRNDNTTLGVIVIKNLDVNDNVQDDIDTICADYESDGIEFYVTDIIHALIDMGYEAEYREVEFFTNLYV